MGKIAHAKKTEVTTAIGIDAARLKQGLALGSTSTIIGLGGSDSDSGKDRDKEQSRFEELHGWGNVMEW